MRQRGIAVVLLSIVPATVFATLPFIELNPQCPTAFREKGSEQLFVPIGVNYFDPLTGWAPKIWKQFDEQRVARHLDLLQEQHFNCIRVFLTLQSFHQEPGKVAAEGVKKFRRLLELCRQREIHVIPTGPDYWEGAPAWRGPDPFADEQVLEADQAWWREFANQFANEPAILAWDLYNEPAVRWDTSAMRSQWNRWLTERYGSPEKIAAAWGVPIAHVGQPNAIAIPPAQPALNDPQLYDYQLFRESIGQAWTRRMTAAIRQVDRNHLITVGHVQWASPIFLPTISHYAGFNLREDAALTDFTTIHFYPLDEPRPASPEGIATNSVYLQAVLRECATGGKPIMLGEFGWYGGGEIRSRDNKVIMPAQRVEDQLAWCQHLLGITRGRCCGWMPWGFADVPTSTDTTRWSGCWTTDEQLKPWGRRYGQFAREMANQCEPHAPLPPSPIPLPERKALLTDPKIGNNYRATLLKTLSTSPATPDF